MKKIFFGAIATLMISGSVLANKTSSPSVEEIAKEVKTTIQVDEAIFQVYCILTIRKGDKVIAVHSFPVADGAEGAAQCAALKAAFLAAYNS